MIFILRCDYSSGKFFRKFFVKQFPNLAKLFSVEWMTTMSRWCLCHLWIKSAPGICKPGAAVRAQRTTSVAIQASLKVPIPKWSNKSTFRITVNKVNLFLLKMASGPTTSAELPPQFFFRFRENKIIFWYIIKTTPALFYEKEEIKFLVREKSV